MKLELNQYLKQEGSGDMLQHQGTVLLESSRLLLRRFEMTDTEAFFSNWASDSEVTRYLSWRTHTNRKMTQDVLSGLCAHDTPTQYNWAVVLRGTNEPIGNIVLARIQEEACTGEFGYSLCRRYWGQGLMVEAMQAVLRYLFFTVGFLMVEGSYDLRNTNSCRVMQKLGMTYGGVVSGVYRDNQGNFVDCGHFRLTRAEFESRRVRSAYPHEGVEVGALYERLTEWLAGQENYCGWRTGIYPTPEVALAALAAGTLYVAVVGGRVVGSCSLNSVDTPEYGSVAFPVVTAHPLFLHTLAVDPDYLRQGVAEALLSFAETVASAVGAPCIRLDTAEQNRPAQALYEKMGYQLAGQVDLGLQRSGISNWYVYEKEMKAVKSERGNGKDGE